MRIPIVDENDTILFYKEKSEVDPDKDLYRVSYLWISDPEGKILLAQRSLSKDRHPGKWGSGVAGTVEEGETYESNIIKEAEEELGLKNFTFIPGKKHLVKTNDYSFWSQIFFLELPSRYDKFILEDKVAQVRWFSIEEINEILKTNPEYFIPSMPMILEVGLEYKK